MRTGIVLFLAVLAAAPRALPDAAHLVRAEEAMGTTFSVVLYGRDHAVLEKAAAAAFEEAHRLDAMLSNYQAASEWSEVNRRAPFAPVKVSDELFQLLSACVEYSRQSGGAFDITVGPLVRAWGFYGGEGALPTREQVVKARERVGYQHLRLDPIARTVRFEHAGLELDPGGIGKGYAIDRIVGVLRDMDISVALVSAGGSSIYAMGAPPDSPQGWRVTISRPESPDSPAAEVWLRDMSLSTSGGYEKFFRASGRRYSHIIDPRTGYPAQGTASVSVLAARAIDSEAWTKPYFINGHAWTAAHTGPGVRVFFCEESGTPRCAWIG